MAEISDLDKALAKEGVGPEEEVVDNTPSYKMVGASKIPVSKHLGKLWSSRIDQAKAARKVTEDAWTEAIRYYDNDQSQHRSAEDDASGARPAKRIGRGWTETENIVFTNTTTSLPMLYAKNPSVEITPKSGDTHKAWAAACEALINKLFSMEEAPGVDLKPTVRRGVLWTMLTNAAYSKVGFNKKEDSTEGVLEELRKVSLEYANAQNKKEIEIAEGKLKALEEKVSLLTPSGPSVGLVNPFNLYFDPTGIKGNHSDAAWAVERDYLPTHYLNAVYGKNQEGKIVSVYEPTHVLNTSTRGDGSTSLEDEINNFSLLGTAEDKDKIAASYGYKTQVAFEKSQYTMVWWIWDKTTRRLFLYADNKWDWPLWVWDDPLKLQSFYPYRHLWFHETVEGSLPKGEVTYYLDQQDRINDTNAALAQARDWVKNNVFYDRNSGITAEQVQKVLKGPNGTAEGIDVPEGKKMTDVIFSVPPPALAYPQLLDNASAYEAINKVTGITAAQQGAQFKTNTTNDAVNFYQKNVDIRIDEKIDCIEDWIGGIGWQLIQILAMNWEMEQVVEVIGEEAAQGWRRVDDANELRKHLNLRVVGGSTDKPTSKNKKNQALEIAQVLGQFGNGIPAVAIIALKVLSRAFSDDVTITETDWNMVFQSMEQQVNKAGAGPGGDPAAAGGAEGSDPKDSMTNEQITKLVKSLPPEVQGQLEGLLNEGVPPQKAIEMIMAQATQQQAA